MGAKQCPLGSHSHNSLKADACPEAYAEKRAAQRFYYRVQQWEKREAAALRTNRARRRRRLSA